MLDQYPYNELLFLFLGFLDEEEDEQEGWDDEDVLEEERHLVGDTLVDDAAEKLAHGHGDGVKKPLEPVVFPRCSLGTRSAKRAEEDAITRTWSNPRRGMAIRSRMKSPYMNSGTVTAHRM